MVYGILRLINFAHGDVFMCAALMVIYSASYMPLYISLPLAIVATGVLGFAIERVAYKPLRTAPRMSAMISAIGMSYLIQNLALYVTLKQQHCHIGKLLMRFYFHATYDITYVT